MLGQVELLLAIALFLSVRSFLPKAQPNRGSLIHASNPVGSGAHPNEPMSQPIVDGF